MTKTVITDKKADPQAALPPGSLKRPLLDRHGDEHREPSDQEKQKLAEIQKRQNAGGE